MLLAVHKLLYLQRQQFSKANSSLLHSIVTNDLINVDFVSVGTNDLINAHLFSN